MGKYLERVCLYSCRTLGIVVILLGAPKVFHTYMYMYYAILGIMSTGPRSATASFVCIMGLASICVPDYNALYHIGCD